MPKPLGGIMLAAQIEYEHSSVPAGFSSAVFLLYP